MYEYAPEQAPANAPVETSCFYGLNRLRKGTHGEFESMRNMSGREYPCLAPRGERVKICDTSNVMAACAPDSTDTAEITGFTGIAGERFMYNGVVKSGSVRLGAKYKWSIIRLGNLYIMNGYAGVDSAMYYYNVDTGEFGRAVAGRDNLIVTSGTDGTGDYLKTFRYGFGDVLDYSFNNADGDKVSNGTFFEEYGMYGGSSMSDSNLFEALFKPGDEVTISGFPTQESNRGETWRYTSKDGVTAVRGGFDGNNTVDTDLYASLDGIPRGAICTALVKSFSVTRHNIDAGRGTSYEHLIYFDLYDKNGDVTHFDDMSSSSTSATYCTGVSVSKRTRHFTHIAAHHGRIWGTSPTGNMIYASAADDIFSFASNDITSGFAARLASDSEGTFTGLCEYGGELVAFKENSITVVYGSGVSSYGSETITGMGCIDGDSIAVTPSGVIFLSYSGFYMYSGTASPSRLSEKLNRGYKSAVGGWDGILYYASAVDTDGARELIVYDTAHGLWHVHDDFAADAFFRFRGGFYISGGGGLYRQTDTPGTDEWEFTSVRAMDGTLDNKAVNEIWILCDMSEGAYMKIWTSVDSGEFVMHRAYAMEGLNVIRCPVRAKNGTLYRYRITGAGGVVFYDVEIRKAGSEGRNHTETAVSLPPQARAASAEETY